MPTLKKTSQKQATVKKSVAARCEMDFGSYTNIENGKRNITLFTLQKILIALNISFKEFFNFKGFFFLKPS